jgi:protein-S-isoprenylcysteine O-methyltransferase Ste14
MVEAVTSTWSASTIWLQARGTRRIDSRSTEPLIAHARRVKSPTVPGSLRADTPAEVALLQCLIAMATSHGSLSIQTWNHAIARRFADLLLFSVTSVELALLVYLTPAFTFTDWIYLLQHLLVLGIAVTRRLPAIQDHSLPTSAAVAVSYAYPYAQMVYLAWIPGEPAWPDAGFVVVTIAAFLSLASLVSLGRSFGVRPALRSLVMKGPYRLVRHPMYLAYVLSDTGYNLQEWNLGTVLLTLVGWVSLLYRIRAEERVLSRDGRWPGYIGSVQYRLLPGLW